MDGTWTQWAPTAPLGMPASPWHGEASMDRLPSVDLLALLAKLPVAGALG